MVKNDDSDGNTDTTRGSCLKLVTAFAKSSVIAIPIMPHVAATSIRCSQELLTISRARQSVADLLGSLGGRGPPKVL
ncbi:unnamed protein product [Sphenostylis stenocarpa]|uniref:Uncharacterized protein n=1 Tax=Sphenostylis stenocarpa TaxID=92480 RepID=A0AA86S4G6_9FABA|nr:unnamed protein product [Sphenostylis stenocarpa]